MSVTQPTPISASITIGSAAELGISDQSIAEFYAENWARPIALSRVDFIEWQMRKAPAAQGNNHSVLAVQNGAILAVMGVNPAPFLHDGKSLAGAELTTWIVSAQARGTGVGGRMLRYLQDRYEVLLGGGISPAAQPLYLGAGFAFLAHIPRFFFVADFKGIETFASPSPAALQRTEARQFAARKLQYHAEPVAAAALVHEARQQGLSQLERNPARLAWRYDHHPIFRYEAFRIQTEGASAGVILRFDRIEGQEIAHLVDIFGDTSPLPAALAFVEAEALRHGAAFVDFSGTSGVISGILRSRGWSSVLDAPLIELPSLFHPIEFRHPPTSSLTIWAREAREQLYNFANLHLTKADLDFDRPTLAYLERA